MEDEKKKLDKSWRMLPGGKIITPKFRLSFPDFFKRGEYQGKDTGYGACLIWDDNETDMAFLEEVIERLVIANFPNGKPRKFSSPIRDGIERTSIGFSEGKVFISARSRKEKIVFYDIDGREIKTDNGELYGGCYCVASISTWVRTDLANPGVSFNLHQVKKVADGPRFGGISNLGDDFGCAEVNQNQGDFNTPTSEDDIPF